MDCYNVTARDYLSRIEMPVLGLYPTAGLITSTEQEDALVNGIKKLTMVHLATNCHSIAMLKPALCAGQLLYFAGQHNGIVCRE